MEVNPFTLLLLGAAQVNPQAVITLIDTARSSREIIDSCESGQTFDDLLKTKLKANDLIWFKNFTLGLMLEPILAELNELMSTTDPEMN